MVLPTMKDQKEKFVKICPKCGSKDVQTDYSNAAVWAYGAPTSNKCDNCSHVAKVFPEVAESELKDFKPQKVDKTVDTKTGESIGYLVWIVIPLIAAIISFVLISYIVGIILLVIALALYISHVMSKR